MTAAHCERSELPVGLFIENTWVQESTGGLMEHVNPATGKVQTSFPVAGPKEVADAVAAARDALPAWRSWDPVDRRRVLCRIADGLRVRADEVGRIATLENGTPSLFSGMFAPLAADWFEYYAGWAERLEGAVLPVPAALNYTLLEPYGVVAIILTWNSPVGAIGMKVAAALAAGCCVVLKPPELAPFSVNLFAGACVDAGLPAGVVNIVPGGPEAGDALVRHPDVDKVTFTGGPGTARNIQAACAEGHTPLVLELGGKSANIIFDDAQIGMAATSAGMGIIGLSGQTCVAPTRLLVHDSVYDDVVGRVTGVLSSIAVGDPSVATTMMGPLISEAACDRILGMIDRARAEGAGKLLIGGERLRLPGDLAGGYFLPPTVLGDVDNDAEIAQEECFGPILSIIRFGSEREAVEIANRSKYGLVAYLHTADIGRAHRLAAALDAGTVSVNGGAILATPYAPFGGFKGSGYGKEGGRDGIMEFVRTKNVTVSLT